MVVRLEPASDFRDDYDYMMAYGSLNRQRHNNVAAMMGFARAHELSLEDENAERELLHQRFVR